ncbi:helix-turn-helix domain-containing protein [Nonomuraea glycinis]|nr:helix-turn-helix transcriptional regulator [Nonomuraea glycinis]MCA2176535.1 helix-turn-helix domain-containing protein [Nonomuraea glycinis]
MGIGLRFVGVAVGEGNGGRGGRWQTFASAFVRSCRVGRVAGRLLVVLACGGPGRGSIIDNGCSCGHSALGGGVVGRPELVRARKRLGMSQEDAAEALLVTPTTLSRWERGAQDVRPVYRARIAQVFGVGGAEVERWLHCSDPVGTEVWPLPDFSDMSIAATVKAAAKLWRGELDLERRHLLGALPFVPAALDGWLSSWSYGAPAETAASQGSGQAVGLSDVQRINEMLQTFHTIDHQYGGGVVRPAVVDYLNTQVAPLLRGTYDDKVGSELLVAAVQMTLLAGWTAFDIGHHGQAQHYYGQALKLAKTADDPLAGARVLTTMSHQALHLNRSTYAVLLSRAAVDSARRAQASPRVMALMLTREARATAAQTQPARTGDGHAAKQVERLLGEAERAYGQGPNDRDPAWLVGHDEPQMYAEMGSPWRLLGKHDRAAGYAEQAVREFDVRRPRSAQLNRLAAANAYLGKGEVEQAVDTVRTAVPVAGRMSSPRLVESIRQFDKRLKPYESTVQVREFRAYLDRQLAS